MELSWGIYVQDQGDAELTGFEKFRHRQKNTHGGSINVGDWEPVAEKLALCLKNEGTVTLAAESGTNEYRRLQVQADNGCYIITFEEETQDGHSFRGFENNNGGSDIIVILGDLWQGGAVCRDPLKVVAIFEEFFNTGNVLPQSLKPKNGISDANAAIMGQDHGRWR